VAVSRRPCQLSVSADPPHGVNHRSALTRLFKYCAWIIVAAVIYVLLDFSIDVRPPAVHSSYHFNVANIAPDEARILRQDNLSILLIRRSVATRRRLEQSAESLQDPESNRSHQPDYADNSLRSRHAEYYVSYAIGTDLGCPLQINGTILQETCGSARYDFAGRALKSAKKFPNLSIPDYNFANNFSSLTINPFN
jgi:hypothetical protein